MKGKLKRFFTIDIKKNFTKYKFWYGVAIGVAIACIWCIIAIYAAPYVVQSKEAIATKEIAHAEISTIQLNTPYKIDIGKTWTGTTIPHVSNNTDNTYNTNFTINYNGTTYSGTEIFIDRNYSTSTSKGVSFSFKNSASTYNYIMVSMGTSQKKALGWYQRTASSSTALTSADSVVITFTSTITIPSELQTDLKIILSTAYVNYNVSASITNGTLSPLTIQSNTTNTLQITPANGYVYPETISYTGTASVIDYYAETGEIIITNPTSDFTITAECPSEATTITVGYYLIYPPEIPSTADTIELSFHIISLLSSTIGNSEPLTPVISSTMYNYLDRQTGLQSGLFALTSLQDTEPRELWRDYQDNEQLNGAVIIYVPSQTTITGQHDLLNCLLSISYNQYDALRYWGYGIAVSPNTKAYNLGYADGYDSGVNTQIIGQTTSGIISQIFSGLFGNVLSVEIFPGFPLYIFILIPVVFAVVGLLLWLIRGK